MEILDSSKATWKTKDGRVLRICDMETSHLESAVSMLRRKGHISFEEFSRYAPWSGMGEYAEMYAWQEIDSAKPTKAIDYMEQEIMRRKRNEQIK